MPKVKTHSRAKKTFKVSAGGKILFQRAGRKHLLRKKTKQRKRKMRVSGILDTPNLMFVRRLLRLK